ncbi:MAG: M14 family zinc carboxypeptidase [Chloroflexota bacterium]
MTKFRRNPVTHLLITLTITMGLCLLLTAVITRGAGSTLAQEEEHSVIIEVAWKNHAELNQLWSQYDVWQIFPISQVAYIYGNEATLLQLKAAGWQAKINTERTDFHLHRSEQRTAEDFFGGYKTNTEILAELKRLNAINPELTELFDFGDSYCKLAGGCTTSGGDTLPGHDLWALRISNELVTGTSKISGTTVISDSKPVFMIHAGVHPRELSAAEIALRFADHLIDDYATSPTAQAIVDLQETWIIPMANPDGHDIVILGSEPNYGGIPLLHRKNGRLTGNCTWPSNSGNQYGIDLNRNHSFGWGSTGTSLNPCSLVYRGTSGSSEPETLAFEKLLTDLIPDQKGPNRSDPAPDDTAGILISVHSFGEVIIYSWGDGIQPNSPAPNADGLKAIADRMAAENGYTSIQGNNFGAVSGATDDHVYGTFGIPAYTLELGTTFLQSYEYTANTIWPNNKDALMYAASIASAPYQLVNGPEISELSSAVKAEGFIISGTVSDNSDNILTITVGSSFPLTGTQYPVSAADGVFDSNTETFVVGPIPLSDAADCQPLTFYIRGTDVMGQIGPIGGIIVEQPDCEPPTLSGPEISTLTTTLSADGLFIQGTVSDTVEQILTVTVSITLPLSPTDIPVRAEDGAFDEQIESFLIGPLPSNQLDDCTSQTYYVQGKNILGQVGPIQSIAVIHPNCALNLDPVGYFPFIRTAP